MQKTNPYQESIYKSDTEILAELDENAPPEYKCPITLSIMKNPVIMPDGQTYEREAIERALNINPISPITRKPMNMRNALTNYALKSLIDKYIQDYKQKNNIKSLKTNEKYQNKIESNDFNVEILVSMGFDKRATIDALNNSNNDISIALDLLTNNKKKYNLQKTHQNRPNINRNYKKQIKNVIYIIIIVFLVVFFVSSDSSFIELLGIHFLNTTIIIMSFLSKLFQFICSALSFIGEKSVYLLKILQQLISSLFTKLCKFSNFVYPFIQKTLSFLYSKISGFIVFISPFMRNIFSFLFDFLKNMILALSLAASGIVTFAISFCEVVLSFATQICVMVGLM